MNIHQIHSELHSQTADAGPGLAAPLAATEDALTLHVCAVELNHNKDHWKTLALALLRGFKQIQGRTVERVKYSAVRDAETNPDGTCGTIQIDLSPTPNLKED